MRKSILVLFPLILSASVAEARARIQGNCEQGGFQVSVANGAATSTNSSGAATKWQQSYPSCTVSIYLAGTTTLASIFSDNSGTVLANPFTADSTGHWFAYADNGRFDVTMSGGGIPTPFTLGDLMPFDPAGLNLNGVFYIGNGSGLAGDIGAQFNAVYSACPSNGCEIDLLPNPAGCYADTTQMTATVVGKYLLFRGLGAGKPEPSAGPCINFTPTTGITMMVLDYAPANKALMVPAHGIRNITFMNNGCVTTGGCGSLAFGIQVGAVNQGIQGATMDSVTIAGFADGFVNTNFNSVDVTWLNPLFLANGEGYFDTNVNSQTVISGQFYANGIAVRAGAGVGGEFKFLGTNFLGNTVATFDFTAATFPVTFDCISCHLENDTTVNKTTHFVQGNWNGNLIGGLAEDDVQSGVCTSQCDYYISSSGVWINIQGMQFSAPVRVPTQVIQLLSPVRAHIDAINNRPTILTTMVGGANAAKADVHILNADSANTAAPTSYESAFTSPNINGILYVGTAAGQYASLQAAHDALPAGGGTVFVTATGKPFGAANTTTLTISKPIHIVFDVAAYTYAGTTQAILTTGAPSGVLIEGSGIPDLNQAAQGTSITITGTAVNGLDIFGPSISIKNFSINGPGSGTGLGIHISGNGFLAENVQVKSFGSDNWQIDGTRGNTNSFVMIRDRSYSSGGIGFNAFGVNTNQGSWINTDSQNGSNLNYVFNGSMSQTFVGLHANPSADVTSIQFLGSSSNTGTIYIEPFTPFTANCLTFDATSKNNNLYLLNCRAVGDSGTLNQWYFAAADAGVGVSATGSQQLATSNNLNVINVYQKVQRATSTAELLQKGIFFKNANFFSGPTWTTAASLNFIFNTTGTSYATRFFNNCTGDISACTPILTLNSTTAVASVPISIGPVLVGALPGAAAGNKGQMISVSDSTAVAAEGQTCVGGSTNTALAFSNGVAWKCF